MSFLSGDKLLAPLRLHIPDAWKSNTKWAWEFRKQGESEFKNRGLPTQKDEAWKYTDLTPITEMEFSFNTEEKDPLNQDLIKTMLPEKLSLCTLIFIDGIFSEQYSLIPKVKDIYINSLNDELNKNGEKILELLGQSYEGETDELTSLNRAYLNNGAIIKIGKNISPDFPIHLIFLSINRNSLQMYHPRNLVFAGEGADFSIIEEYTGENNSTYFTNTVTEIFLKEGASVDHYKIQRESPLSFHIGSLNVIQSGNTKFTSQTASFGGKLTRNNIFSSMNGPGSESNIEGLYFLKGTQHIDNHTTISHNSPHCRSSENFNGVLDDGSRAVFDGKIYVGRDSVQTDSSQSNRSLMLSDNSSVDSKPTLEIYADDVKCSHSASVGQLDTDTLYYLRSRGIGEKESMKILTSGFLKEILDKFSNKDVSKRVENILNSEIKE